MYLNQTSLSSRFHEEETVRSRQLLQVHGVWIEQQQRLQPLVYPLPACFMIRGFGNWTTPGIFGHETFGFQLRVMLVHADKLSFCAAGPGKTDFHLSAKRFT